jgi:hypothetical protein
MCLCIAPHRIINTGTTLQREGHSARAECACVWMSGIDESRLLMSPSSLISAGLGVRVGDRVVRWDEGGPGLIFSTARFHMLELTKLADFVGRHQLLKGACVLHCSVCARKRLQGNSIGATGATSAYTRSRECCAGSFERIK